LAVALGVGAAVLGGTAVGWADDDAGSASAASNSSSAQSSRPGREARGTAAPATGGREAAGAATARSSITPDSAAAASPRGGQPSGVAQRGSELSPLDIPDTTFDNTDRPALPQFAAVPALADAQPVAEVPAVEAALAAPAAAQSAPAADEPAVVPAAAVQAVTVAEPVTEPLTAPESAPVASILTAAVNALTDPFADGTPGVPVDSTLDWTALAFARRNPLSAASTVPLPQRAAVTAPTLPLIMGPSGVPIPSQGYGDVVMAYYIPDATQGTQQLLFTPEGLYPITGVKSLPLDTSTDQGVQILSDALSSLPAQTKVTVFGYSQSAIISSLLQGGYTITVDGKPKTFTVPSDLDVSFVMVGDEMNPDGGFLSRFSGRDMPIFSLTSLGIPFYGATPGGQIPPDGGPIQTYYDTTVYTREYDGFADFPRYPINFLADLKAKGLSTKDDIDALVGEFTAQHAKQFLFDLLMQHRVPCAPVRNLDEVVNDAHMHERGALEWVEHPMYGRICLMHSALRFQGSDPLPIRPSGELGRDNREVYGQWLGLSDSQLQQLVDEEVI
jgi:hypothetical protein